MIGVGTNPVSFVVPGLDLFLYEGINHFLAEVVHGFHVGGLEKKFAALDTTAGSWSVDLDFHDLTFDDFGFFFDADADRTAEGLHESLRL